MDRPNAAPKNGGDAPISPTPSASGMSFIRLVGVLLAGAAGIGALAAAVGFALLTARLVAAELPVVEGLDLFSVRSAVATGVRTLAFPLLVGAFAGPLVAAAARERRIPERRDRDPGLRSVIVPLTVVSWAALAVVLLYFDLWLFDALVPGAPWPLPQVVWIVLVGALGIWARRHARPPGTSIPRRLWLTVPFALIVLLFAPLPFGVVTGTLVGVVFWILHPENSAHVESSEKQRTLFATGGAVFIVTLIVSLQALSPQVTFNRAIVTLDRGAPLAGGWVGRGEGAVVLAGCTADPRTVDAEFRKDRSAWFSRSGRFVIIAGDRVAAVRITDDPYVFNPGRYRTLFGAIFAVSNSGPEPGTGVPATVRTTSHASRRTC